ncbi:MAG: hypothetical protein RLZZ623_3793 [Actinomycetota bacterium]|jgi:lysophospholipase L1-like esterase
MRIRREVVGALSAVLLAACSAVAASPNDPGAPASTLPSPVVEGVGVLPGDLPVATVAPTQLGTTALSTTTSSTVPPEPFVAAGNRILLIGDSILASTASRYSNDTCKALVPLGWQVEVEAEISRGIDFAKAVWRSRGSQHWDVVLVFLGTNYNGDAKDYLRRLNTMIKDAGDAKVVLVTVSEYRPEQADVNRTLRSIADVYDNVSVLDWSTFTAQKPELLNEDHIHPTPAGRKVLAGAIAFHLGQAPASPGKCLDSYFTDDTAGSLDTGATTTTVKVSNGSTGATTTTVKVTSTTIKPSTSTSTTVKPGTSTSTTVSSVPVTTGSTVVTTAPPTSPPTPTTTLPPVPGQ